MEQPNLSVYWEQASHMANKSPELILWNNPTRNFEIYYKDLNNDIEEKFIDESFQIQREKRSRLAEEKRTEEESYQTGGRDRILRKESCEEKGQITLRGISS